MDILEKAKISEHVKFWGDVDDEGLKYLSKAKDLLDLRKLLNDIGKNNTAIYLLSCKELVNNLLDSFPLEADTVGFLFKEGLLSKKIKSIEETKENIQQLIAVFKECGRGDRYNLTFAAVKTRKELLAAEILKVYEDFQDLEELLYDFDIEDDDKSFILKASLVAKHIDLIKHIFKLQLNGELPKIEGKALQYYDEDNIEEILSKIKQKVYNLKDGEIFRSIILNIYKNPHEGVKNKAKNWIMKNVPPSLFL